MTIQEMSRKGGKASVTKRFAGKSKSEVSEMMRMVRIKKCVAKMSEAIREEQKNFS